MHGARIGTLLAAHRHSWPWVLALGAFIIALATSAAPTAGEERRPLNAHDIARIRAVTAAEISPDGAHIAYLLSVQRRPVEDPDGAVWVELHVVGLDGTSRPYVTGEVNVSHLGWHPDGSAISFLAQRPGDEHRSLWAIPLDGGEARRLVAHDADLSGYSWSPDGQRIAFLSSEGKPEEDQRLADQGFDQVIFEEELRPVEVWIATLGEEGTTRAEHRRLELPGSASELHWSPTGDRLALALAPTPLIDHHYMFRRVHVVDVEGGEVLARIDNPGKLGQIAWSPDGHHLALVSAADINDSLEGRLKVVPATGGPLVEILPDYLGHVREIAWLDESSLLYVGAEGVWTSLGRATRDGTRLATVTSLEGPIWSNLSLSREGRVLGLVAHTPEHPAEVYRFDLGAEQPGPARLTNSNPWLAERLLAAQEIVTYPARDGLDIEGLLMRPLGVEESGPHPMVLVVHGGPEAHYSNGWLTTYAQPSQALAGKGLAVFLPNYRGSTGRGVEFTKLSFGDPAGSEFDDLIDGIDHLVEVGLVDPERVGITGGSYGGYATAWGSTFYSERFAAGVMFVGISNTLSKSGTSDIPQEMYHVHFGFWPWEDWSLLLERSPIFHAERGRTPLLIATGDRDTRVHPTQSMQLYRYLAVQGHTPVRLVLYPGEGHGNRRAASRLDYSLRLLRWMEHYLLGPGGDPPPPRLEYELGTQGEN